MNYMYNQVAIPDWTKEDYTTGTSPFDWLYQYKDNKFLLVQLKERIKEKAGSVGVKNFVALWTAYLSIMKTKDGIFEDNVTMFDNQPLELKCGDYVCDDFGITTTDKFGCEIIVCNHPILPIKRIINIDTEEVKIEIAFKRGKIWRKLIFDRSTLASSQKIVELSKYGISVDSENAKSLVKYITTLLDLNYELIEETNSVGRFGWMGDYGFSPFVENLTFDGDETVGSVFRAIKQQGKRESWLNHIKEVRENSTVIKIVLATSLSSVLIKHCNALPFFLHLWSGGMSNTGKTVALMVAASVWGSPQKGEYWKTFNGSIVGMEMMATCVNSLPLLLDELQIKKDRKNFDDIIYMLSEGVGKIRGKKTGGLQKTGTWHNCIISNGEYPILNYNSGSGAVNRVIEINSGTEKLFQDPVKTVDVVMKNYGFIGKEFVIKLMEDNNIEKAVMLQKEFYDKLSKTDTTEKQSLSASIILTADALLDEWIFQSGKPLTIDDIKGYLSTNKEVSQNERALLFINEFVTINQNKFVKGTIDEQLTDIWGAIDDNYFYIIKTKFDQFMFDNGYNATAFLSWAMQKNYIEQQNGRNTKIKKIMGNCSRCVWLKRSIFSEYETEEWAEINSNLPF